MGSSIKIAVSNHLTLHIIPALTSKRRVDNKATFKVGHMMPDPKGEITLIL